MKPNSPSLIVAAFAIVSQIRLPQQGRICHHPAVPLVLPFLLMLLATLGSGASPALATAYTCDRAATGAVTLEAQYEAFGTRKAQTGTAVGRQQANTKDEDSTGLLNEGFRYCDLETGSFITRDPAGFVDAPNVNTYVRQNPWPNIDPDGLAFYAFVGTNNDREKMKGFETNVALFEKGADGKNVRNICRIKYPE